MVKVGDRVKVEGEWGGDIRNGLGVIEDIGFTRMGIRLDNGNYVAAELRNITAITQPPQKITQNGYEYSLVGPVKPEWLVDGAWVVNVHDGEKRLIEEVNPGVFNLKVNDLVSIRYHEGIRDQYRTHTESDWKWGDWALYEGKRVFVMRETDCDGDIAISGIGLGVTSNNYTYVKLSELTPTF